MTEPWIPGRRISVVGCSGAGKTTLARRLARQLGYRHVELDALYHQPDWQPLPTERFQQAVAEALEGDDWVVEGNYSSVRPLVLERADTVIWLDLPRASVMRQLVLRTLKRVLGRQVLWNGNRERWSNLYSLNPEHSVIAWAWTRYAIHRQRYAAEMLNARPGLRYLHLASHGAVDALLARTADRPPGTDAQPARARAGDTLESMPPLR
ncbi:AAA family ATPase [Pseudomonas sp. RIT-PI-AD]|uniref:AAA family ATPase n=1 Tax=Pseudomonas sp. RIT-PI-AD TaxID=3035294 RepID=UPI0021DB3908|nr:AAA family ATPase [Pseudomonas sp. RIT-PI-AD]